MKNRIFLAIALVMSSSAFAAEPTCGTIKSIKITSYGTTLAYTETTLNTQNGEKSVGVYGGLSATLLIAKNSGSMVCVTPTPEGSLVEIK